MKQEAELIAEECGTKFVLESDRCGFFYGNHGGSVVSFDELEEKHIEAAYNLAYSELDYWTLNMGRRFYLVRDEDESGVSGTGVVAVGWCSPKGFCFMEWIVPPYSWSVHRSPEDMITVHGHGGKTQLRWKDENAE